MKGDRLELSVGVFVLMGLLSLAWLSIKLARMEIIAGDHVPIYARFSSVSGLKTGATVEIAGVTVGRVDQILLDAKGYEAKVRMLLTPDIPIQEDAIASIRTKGLIGDRYVSISPGGSDSLLKANGMIVQTEPAINFEELISQFVHGKL
ncbi:MAG: outer membrane lipid asymmetry maintenance protein MlaD [Magnetococcales bacterium]|nr:outer membrane lipid asymmetry maintenance protein MlaD [Magnetococcales bacterium]